MNIQQLMALYQSEGGISDAAIAHQRMNEMKQNAVNAPGAQWHDGMYGSYGEGSTPFRGGYGNQGNQSGGLNISDLMQMFQGMGGQQQAAPAPQQQAPAQPDPRIPQNLAPDVRSSLPGAGAAYDGWEQDLRKLGLI